MRNSVYSDVRRDPPKRDRKIFSSMLLLGAACCMTLSALHVELSTSSMTNLLMNGGRRIVEPLMLTVKRRSTW